MHGIGRRTLMLSAAAAALLAACGGSSGGAGVTEDDVVLGAADAPVTLIEYASTTCPHCATFHAEAWEQLKTNYIDTGRVRFVFREFPTAPEAVAVAGFQIARCGGASPDQYFVRITELFRQQQATFATGSMEGVRRKLLEIGQAAGLSEAQINECINDPEGAARIRRIATASREHNVTGTPTLIINGSQYAGALTYEALSAALDAAGAARTSG
jgi:protein-disulfide isomerase